MKHSMRDYAYNSEKMRTASINMLSVFVYCSIYFVSVAVCQQTDRLTSPNARGPNVLFIMADDLRPEIGCFEESIPFSTPMHTPNIDRLGAQSIIFRRAFVQQSVCSPSRTSMLTSRRPDTTRVHDLTQYWRNVAGNFTTLPQYLKENGFLTAGIGKIFQPGRPSGHNDPLSWTEEYFSPDESYWQKRNHDSWFAADEGEVLVHPLPDIQILDAAVKKLGQFAEQEKPFFLAVGFHKPHLPFMFPSRFLELYPLWNITLPRNPFAPFDFPEFAWSNFDELRKYDDIRNRYGYGAINTTLPKQVVLELRRAYYSSISYIDFLIGELLDAVAQLGLESSIVISFLGDHGWQLGEHGEWCKHTNFELATRAPLMISIPGKTNRLGVKTKTDVLVEFVDIFPTIVEAVGLPVLSLCPENSSSVLLCTEGVSLMPVINNPEREWKRAVFSQYPRMMVSGDILMGYSMRTERYRYTEWVYYDAVEYRPMWEKKRKYRELYDHFIDPEEDVNIANLPEFSYLVQLLSHDLRDGWRKALPP